jgi:RNA polymerase sigma-70 factor (ECF subfamily)
MEIAPSVGARVAQAAAVGEAQGADAGLVLLDALAARDMASYQPYWAVRAHLLRERGDADQARRAYDLAIGLAEDPAIKRFLLSRR